MNPIFWYVYFAAGILVTLHVTFCILADIRWYLLGEILVRTPILVPLLIAVAGWLPIVNLDILLLFIMDWVEVLFPHNKEG